MWLGTGHNMGALRRLTSGFSETEVVRNADPVNVRLRGVNVTGRQDLGESLDLVVVTRFQFANQPIVTRLHYMEQGAAHGWYDALFQNMVFTTRDFSHDDVTIRVQVYDRDNLERSTVETIAGLAATVAPAVGFLDLAGHADAAESASGLLTSVVNSLTDNDEVLDERVRLEPDEAPNQGTDRLQPGYLVAFADDRIEPGAHRLNQDTRLETPDGTVIDDRPYAVFEVEREHDEVEFSEKDQKAAKLAAELNGRGESNKDPLHYLQETLDSYDTFDRIQRAKQLQRLSDQADVTLTESQRTLLSNLKADLETAVYLD